MEITEPFRDMRKDDFGKGKSMCQDSEVGVSLTILRNKEKANVLYNMNFAWIGQDYTSILSLLPNDTIFFSTRAHGSASRNNKDRG